MRPVALCLALATGLVLAGGLAGLGGLEALLTRTGEPLIRELSPDRARTLAASGSVLRVRAQRRASGSRQNRDIVWIDPDAPLPAAAAWIVVGDDEAAWALAARLAREGGRPVAITSADAWPAPRTAHRGQ